MSSSNDWASVIPPYMIYYNDLYHHIDDAKHFIIFVEGKTDPDHLASIFTRQMNKEIKDMYTFNIEKKDIFYDFTNKFQSVDDYGMLKDSIEDVSLYNDVSGSLKEQYDDLLEDYNRNVPVSRSYRNYYFVIECIKEWNNNKENLCYIECFGFIDRDANNHNINGINNLVQTKFHDLETSVIRPVFKKYIINKVDSFFETTMAHILRTQNDKLKDKFAETNLHEILNGSISKKRPEKLYHLLGYNSKEDLINSICEKLSLPYLEHYNEDDNNKIYEYLKNKYRECLIEKIIKLLLFTTKQGIAEIASFRLSRNDNRKWIIHDQFKNKKIGEQKNPNYICWLDFNSILNFEEGDEPFLNDRNIIRNRTYKQELDNVVINKCNVFFNINDKLDESSFNKNFVSLLKKWFNSDPCSNIDNNAIDDIFTISNGHFILLGMCNIFNDYKAYDEKDLFKEIFNFFDSNDIQYIYMYSPLYNLKNAYDSFINSNSISYSNILTV